MPLSWIRKNEPKQFDLNIDKILENWECRHAIREIIANALDEQKLTGTRDIEIIKESDYWIIRDYGRGLRYEHLVQKENSEKLNTPGLIGKFGIGLKDALATFDRHGVEVSIFSKYSDITICRLNKKGFDNLVTLHAKIMEPTRKIEGTEFRLSNISDSDMSEAKKMFLKFSKEPIIGNARFGEVLERNSNGGNIYINGVLVANEPNFLFGYNITNLDSQLKKSINRERSNVGRSAYAPLVRKILLNCESEDVCKKLSDDLSQFSQGENHDELKWIDVQEHAVRITAKSKPVVFVTTNDIKEHTDLVNEAGNNNRNVVVIPENLSKKIEITNNSETTDKITTFKEFTKQRSENYEYLFSDEITFSEEEKYNYNLIDSIFELIGGKPAIIKEIKISETMQKDIVTFSPCQGLWDPKTNRIIIYREILKDKKKFLGTLLHEIAHAKSGCSDASRGFEQELTNMLGIVSATLLKNKI